MTDTEYRLRSQGVSDQDLAKFNELWPKVQKQAKIKPKYRLPSFDCPNCSAKNILFAGDTVRKNETIMKVLEENDSVDYVIVCPKCKEHIGVRRNLGRIGDGIRNSAVGVIFQNTFEYEMRIGVKSNKINDPSMILLLFNLSFGIVYLLKIIRRYCHEI